ncbi:dihydroneopterin aldolase [Dysgonomonas sp. PH5-45]|uniref:dihydroneopterin aldolase n=1 Tax=unclassified Dysgonomonas TaxID=2630389 RepID=UPI002475351C|nr:MULTISPECIES: dihydroneopterin aldolase [unclassified Dysgonomonas]MDH6355671.1 dihydroneopterin aldolase [Dysgonomonas sp. PH5-45]MDH6388568.1 dihydroneopterin aldolase [Dysgonomonas sp. PH5-37]
MKGYILLENIEIYAHHGVFEQETVVGNTFIVNLKAEVEMEAACQSDQLSGTVSYADVYDIVKEEMLIPSKLLEHVAYRIISRLKATYGSINGIELKISKRNPPIGGQVDFASVILVD